VYDRARCELAQTHVLDLRPPHRPRHLPPSARDPGGRLRALRAQRQLVFLSGHIAKRDGKVWVGQLGRDMTVATGKKAARAVGIDLLGTLHAAVGDLDKVERIVRLTSLVNSAPDFTEHHLVTNGCSELFGEVFADKGAHARSAYGVAQLPLGACVEIELIAQVAGTAAGE
jgi:enamine deaminase RidA (YjgF/YER057c/UK114 family)